MKRDIKRLGAEIADVIVIGAGIHGACVARDAALRGLRVVVLERGDLGGETSHNSLKTIHGGIRYIQHLNFVRTLESIKEQIIWLRTAPHLVRPLPFLMPTYGHGMRGPVAMFAGIQIYRALGLGRNRCLAEPSRIQPGRVIGAKAARALVPDIPGAGLTGAALWDDAQVRFADRAILEILSDAAVYGAQVTNYAEATAILQEGGRAAGVAFRDHIGGGTHYVHGRIVVNAAGPWVGDLATDLSSAVANMPLTRSMNIVTRKPPLDFALSITSEQVSDSRVGKTKRLYFQVPWEDCSVFGTTHAPDTDGPDSLEAQTADIAAFIQELNRAWPGLELSMDDVLYCYRGLTPAEDTQGGQSRSHKSRIIDHKREGGLDGMLSVIGVKWTTGRLVAERAVDLVVGKLGTGAAGCTREAPLPILKDISYDLAGKSADEIAKICRGHMEHTQTQTLRDMLLRRTNDLVRGHLSPSEIGVVAQTMRAYLGWDAEACARQAVLMQNHWLPQDVMQVFKTDDLFESDEP